jgi:hypothetical protein
MFYNAKGGSVEVGEIGMEYVVFGCWEKPFVILPGLIDGLKTVYKRRKTVVFRRFPAPSA